MPGSQAELWQPHCMSPPLGTVDWQHSFKLISSGSHTGTGTLALCEMQHVALLCSRELARLFLHHHHVAQTLVSPSI